MTAVLREAAAQHEIFAAVLDALRTAPACLVVEDLHWADEATLDLVRFLGPPHRRAAAAAGAVLPRGRGRRRTRCAPCWATSVAAPDARRLQLTPLSRSAVAELVDGHGLDPADVHAPHGGQPVLRQPDPRPAGLAAARERARRRARADGRRSPRPSAGALELLSCAPDGVGGELLAALGVPPATVEALAATGLLDRRGRGVAFRHEIARSAVLGRGRRRARNRRCTQR